VEKDFDEERGKLRSWFTVLATNGIGAEGVSEGVGTAGAALSESNYGAVGVIGTCVVMQEPEPCFSLSLACSRLIAPFNLEHWRSWPSLVRVAANLPSCPC
jgi:hypothetical protein